MPVTRTAKRALRKSQRRTELNKPVRSQARTLVKKVFATPTTENMAEAYSALDRATKKRLVHANKVSRLKKQIAAAVKGAK